MLGAYTFLDAIWTMIVFFAFVMLVMWVVMLMIDNFRRTDHSGWAKAGWFLLLIFLPILGALMYTVTRPETASDYYEAGTTYATTTSTATELAQLNDLRAAGAISDTEFEQLKQKTIAAS